MLKLLSDINQAAKYDYDAADDVIASGIQGMFVTIDSDDTLQYPTDGDMHSFPVWSESYRDGTAGNWNTTIDATGKLTILDNYVRGITDQVSSYDSLALGDMLKVDANGKLTKTTDATEKVAFVKKKHDSVTVLGTEFTDCVEFIMR